MRSTLHWTLLVIAIVATLVVAAHSGLFPRGAQTVAWLGTQPEVQSMFSDPEHGRADARRALVVFTLGAPLAVGVATLLVAFLARQVVGAVAPLTGGLRRSAPFWESLVTVGTVVAIVSVRELWLPDVMRLLGVGARAYLVWVSGG